MTVEQFSGDLDACVGAVCTRVGQNGTDRERGARVVDWHNRQRRIAMPLEMKRPYEFGGAALVASGVLFVVLAFLDFRTGPPPSNGAEILLWRDSQALVLDFVSELFFFATVLLVPTGFVCGNEHAGRDRVLQ